MSAVVAGRAASISATGGDARKVKHSVASCSILPRMVRRLRCAASYAADRVELVVGEARETFDDL